jgi:hypothetical protein
MTRTVARQHCGSEFEVAGQLHLHQLGSQEQEQGGIELTPLDRSRAFEMRPEIEAEDIDHLHRRIVSADRTQSLEVSLAGLSGDDEELADACPLLPGLDKFVHDPVKRSPAERGSPWKGAGRSMHPVLDSGGANYAEPLRQIVR